ncbi:hypothetical protein GSI_05858 [Ganoderma sinense ZZ0214-1]|uniref:Uncharacterized protein n=1 Tax=Ganoderma sinense ZZ0214-1 TaxID=1077348 RepID=A0A2G8SBN7_9APHY|nr:hypothetical protein GSI_05858 [Ganoderma sinense ZZ0214-1]
MVESPALRLYSLFEVVFLVSYGLNKPENQVLLAFAQAGGRAVLGSLSQWLILAGGLRQQVLTYLIIHRVAEGTAWSKNTMNK